MGGSLHETKHNSSRSKCRALRQPHLTLRRARIRDFSQKFLMFRSFPSLSLLLCAAVCLFAGCAEDPRFSRETQYLGGPYGPAPATGAPVDSVSYWDGDGIGGKPSIKISLGEQRAYFYRNGLLVGISQLSTGREGRNTPHGHFSIIQKDRNHASSLYGDYVDAADHV